MSTLSYTSGAPFVAQVQAFVLGGTFTNTDTITLKIGSKSYTVVTGNTSIPAILAVLTSAVSSLSTSAYAEIAETSPANDGATTFTLTANDAGNPFTATLSTNSALGTIDGGSSSTGTTTTASSSPNAWDVPANWSTGAVPVTGDTVILDRDGTQIWHGLNQAGVTLAELRILFRTGELGLPKQNANGYPEYRPDALQIGATLLTVNSEQSGRVKVNTGSAASTANVTSSGTGEEQDVPAVLLVGTSLTLNVMGGEVGVGFYAEASTLTGYTQAAGSVVTGANCTLGGATKVKGGTLTAQNPASITLTMLAGTVTLNGTGAPSQLTLEGGVCVVNTTGTVGGNTVVSGNAFLDYTQDSRSGKVVTNPITVYGSAGGSDAKQVIARPYTVVFSQGQGQWDYGPNTAIAIS